MNDTTDQPLDADVAELNREAQRAVDRAIAARLEMDASIANLSEVRAKIANGSAAAVAFIDAYTNPAAPNPAPVAPDVAATPPAEEPGVYTTVTDPIVAPDNSSGGAAVIADELIVVGENEPIAADPESPAPGEPSGEPGAF